MPPLGIPSSGAANFGAAVDQTGSRSLGTNYTAGARRRLVFVSLVCAAVIAGQALAGFQTVCAGTAWTMPAIVGSPSGVTVTTRQMLVIPVDPGGTYQVTTSITGTGSVAIQQWLEVDL